MNEITSPDVTHVPDDAPASVKKLEKARDTAYERWDNLYIDHHDVVSSEWERIATDKDRAAGRLAVEEGRDPLDVPSEVEAAKRVRGRILGALAGLKTEVDRADSKVRRALVEAAPAMGEKYAADVAITAQAYEDAWAALLAARGAFGAAVTRRRWGQEVQADSRRPYPQVREAVPMDARGQYVQEYGRDVIGTPEVRAVLQSFRDAGLDLTDPNPEPVPSDRVTVERQSDGARFVIGRDFAERTDSLTILEDA